MARFQLQESSKRPLVAENAKVLSGPFATLGVFNQNNRRYPDAIYEEAYNKLLPKIQEGRLLGELDHPLNYDEVRLSNVSHIVTEASIRETANGKEVYGKVQLLDTPAGKIVQALVEAGVPIGISSRGFGNTRTVKEGAEVTDLTLITYDLVAEPSFANAVLMSESAKATLASRLDSIERTLPLNESEGENTSTRAQIRNIKEALKKVKDPMEELVESLGQATMEEERAKSLLEESKIRNKNLKDNMAKFQKSYDALKIRESKLVKTVAKLKESNKNYKEKTKAYYESKLIDLQKRLSIEKRGLSVDATLPMLEGLTTEREIEAKLDSMRHLNVRNYDSALKDVSALTEGFDAKPVSKKSSMLSKIVSKV